MRWQVGFLNAVARAEVDALPADMRARFVRIAELIEAHGLDRVGEPYVKHLEAKLWEMRMKGRDGIARSLYVTATGRRWSYYGRSSKKRRKRRGERLIWPSNGRRSLNEPYDHRCRRIDCKVA